MKTIKFYNILTLLLVFIVMSCVQDDDFQVPSSVIPTAEPVGPNDQIIEIGAVLAEQIQSFDGVHTFDVEDQFMVGYVVSSDEGGNFFEEIVLQDKPENPTAGIVVQIDVNPLYTSYEFGRKVYIKLAGLSVAEDNGVIQLGRLEGDNLEKIPAPLQLDHILRSPEVATIVPLEVSISDFSDELENLFVRINNVQFIDNEVLGERVYTFANESTDQFDGERTLISCETAETVILSTSTFSDFGALNLPTGRGSIDAILTRDFFDDFYTIVVNSLTNINFDNPQRCMAIFEESFDAAVDNTNFDFDGWLNYAEEGGELWTEQVFRGNGYAEFSAFRSGDATNIGWLITPGIDLDAQENEILSFQTQHAFPDAGHEPLEVLISTDFDGTEAGILDATWTSLEFDASYELDFDQWFTFMNSGNIDISSFSGTAYIAFKYTGSDTMNQNMTLHVENVRVFVP